MPQRCKVSELWVGVAVIISTLLASPWMYAQVDTGTVVGIVRDEAGSGLGDVKVALKNEATSSKRTALTQDNRTYILTAARSGAHTVSAEPETFARAAERGVIVNPQQQVNVDSSLRATAGAVASGISQGSSSRREDASVGDVIDSNELAWGPSSIVKAPGRALGATVRGLGKLIKRKPKKASPGQAEPTSQPAQTGSTAPSSDQTKGPGQTEPTSEVVQTSPTAPSSGQAKPPTQAEPTSQPAQTGPTAFVQFQGSSSPLGLVLAVVPNVGWQFTRHIAGDIGVPIYFVRSPFSLVTNKDWVWTTIMGSPYIDLRYTTTRNGTNLTSILTGTIPASDSRRTFTTGRGGVDWFNHVEHRFKGLTPFLNFGAANGTVDRYVLPRPYSLARPYQTLGFISQFEAGASYEVLRRFRVGGSVYALLPAGPQTVYSRLVEPSSSVTVVDSSGIATVVTSISSTKIGKVDHNRYFYNSFRTVGSFRIARDNGFSAWIEVTHLGNASVQVGFTRSVHYDLNSINLVVNFDGTSLIRTLTAWHRD